MNELRILDATGDTRITWNNDDEASKAKARAEVARLKTAGFLFFLVDGSPADEITAGNGELVARYVSAEELIEPAKETAIGSAPEPVSEPKRRGRPPGPRGPAPVKAVAVPALRGG